MAALSPVELDKCREQQSSTKEYDPATSSSRGNSIVDEQLCACRASPDWPRDGHCGVVGPTRKASKHSAFLGVSYFRLIGLLWVGYAYTEWCVGRGACLGYFLVRLLSEK